MEENTITDEQLLPDYYNVLSVGYNATSDTIKKAFMALTDDIDTFYLHKDLICDAYTCLASSGDRAAYDAFYYKTTCWYSKKLWLQYRDERRRLDWDDVAKKNADYLADIQQAVMNAFEAALAGDPVGGHAAEKNAAMALSRKTHRCHRPRHHKKGRDKELKGYEENKWEHWIKFEEEMRKIEEEKETERAARQKRAGGNSDSGNSAFSLIEAADAAEARPAGGAGRLPVLPEVSVSSVSASKCMVVANGVFHEPVYELEVYDPNEIILPPNTSPSSFSLVPVPPKSIRASSAADIATDRAALKPKQSEVIAKKTATNATRPAASAAKPAHVPDHSKTQKAATPVVTTRHAPAHTKTQAATATRLTGKIATSTADRTARTARSTATSMTASAAYEANPFQRLTAKNEKQPSSTKPLRRLTAPTMSSAAKATPSQRLTRAPSPGRIAPPVQKKPRTIAFSSTATQSRVTATATARTTAAVADKSTSAPATPMKRGMASSRWAQPQTCANGQPEHPRTLGNWKRLPLMGKCTSCGCTSHGKSAPPSIRHLYWCGTCNAAFCNKCYIANVLRRQ